jgi:hypothetical protein
MFLLSSIMKQTYLNGKIPYLCVVYFSVLKMKFIFKKPLLTLLTPLYSLATNLFKNCFTVKCWEARSLAYSTVDV